MVNIGSESLLKPFKIKAQNSPGSWEASPNEYNAESNAFRITDEWLGRRGIFEPLDEVSAERFNRFGLNFDQSEALWVMGYDNGGFLKRKLK